MESLSEVSAGGTPKLMGKVGAIGLPGTELCACSSGEAWESRWHLNSIPKAAVGSVIWEEPFPSSKHQQEREMNQTPTPGM